LVSGVTVSGNTISGGTINATTGAFSGEVTASSLDISGNITAGSQTTTGDQTIDGTLTVDGATSLQAVSATTGSFSGTINGAVLFATSAAALQWTTPSWGSFSGNGNDAYGDGQNLFVVAAPSAAAGYTFDSSDNRLFCYALTTSGTMLIRFPQGSVDINTYSANGGIQGKNFQATNNYTLSGTTAGSIISSMPDQGYYKCFAAQAIGYENDTTTSQTINFPTAFANTPTITTNTTGLSLSVSTTELTINAPNNTTAYNGFIKIEGF